MKTREERGRKQGRGERKEDKEEREREGGGKRKRRRESQHELSRYGIRCGGGKRTCAVFVKDSVQRSITHTHIHTYLNRTNTRESRIHASHTVHTCTHNLYTPRSLTTTALLHGFIGPFDFRRQSYDFFLNTRRHQTSTAPAAWIIVITGRGGRRGFFQSRLLLISCYYYQQRWVVT